MQAPAAVVAVVVPIRLEASRHSVGAAVVHFRARGDSEEAGLLLLEETPKRRSRAPLEHPRSEVADSRRWEAAAVEAALNHLLAARRRNSEKDIRREEGSLRREEGEEGSEAAALEGEQGEGREEEEDSEVPEEEGSEGPVVVLVPDRPHSAEVLLSAVRAVEAVALAAPAGEAVVDSVVRAEVGLEVEEAVAEGSEEAAAAVAEVAAVGLEVGLADQDSLPWSVRTPSALAKARDSAGVVVVVVAAAAAVEATPCGRCADSGVYVINIVKMLHDVKIDAQCGPRGRGCP